MKLPIGYDNFREIIDHQLDFVDKSLFIKDILDDITTKVSLITRPRRFGKTLNLSMLQHFLAAEADHEPTAGLFDNLKIARVANGAYLKHQGQYPVIALTLKDVKHSSFSDALKAIALIMQKTFNQYYELLSRSEILPNEKNAFLRIVNLQADQIELMQSLAFLSTLIFKCYGKKPWLLIDEYDTPIQSGYLYNHYDEMIGFMRGMFGAALKTNPNFERAVITGILRVAKESLFSGLNNLKVCSILDERYSEYFGFTEEEMTALLEQADLLSQADEIKKWYNGYLFGKTIVYNPWSVANCLNEGGKLRPYWVNTSDNLLVKQLFAVADNPTKIMLESLIRNEPVETLVDEYVTFINMNMSPSAIWSLLLASGYLKAISCRPEENQLKCTLLPPNYEVSLVYRSMVKEWFFDRIGHEQYAEFVGALLKGNITDFTKMLRKFLVETFSVFDVTGTNPEKFYHGFVLGLISSTSETHLIKSNRESGYGRYDVLVMPKAGAKTTVPGLILEFKVAEKNETLLASAQEALQQIEKRHYEAELKQAGISKIIKVGLAFLGKEVEVVWE
ncbi:MAG: hypothetical protein A3C55_05525 [Gammaproteobacteria bacterium RIFCSPHIGHO2_02_FULL_42_13]|nr:MAG: hypothetical protein A3C55_05525 [Gammaproteobacteria bacterium RIFCSPHIGHO2_02_FULL_42_13]OGT68672.1 MAG: hypothetical protein A3H43_01520 [Gammaproteobacteria bacterium RIFCSPLOWO2_02_FULL_42_9]